MTKGHSNHYAIHSYWIISQNELDFLCGLLPYQGLRSKLTDLLNQDTYEKELALETLIYKKMVDYKVDKITLQNFLNFMLSQLIQSSVTRFELDKPIQCTKCTITIQLYKYQSYTYKIAITPKEEV